jgi:HK97 family phage portal protein
VKARDVITTAGAAALASPFARRGAKALRQMAFRNYPGGAQSAGWRMWRMPGSEFDYARAVGDGSGSSTVMATVLWIARTFPEAPAALWQLQGDGTEEMAPPDHPLLRLVNRPNEFYSGSILWAATVIDWTVNGNAYWVKIRDQGGQPIELWWVPSFLMEPWTQPGGTDYVSSYTYRPGDGRTITYGLDDVVHFRYGLDPDDPRLGRSPLASVLKEVFTDNEAATFTSALLRNGGVPGVMISPDSEIVVGQDDVDATKEYMRENFRGEKRGEPLVMSARTKVEQFGFSPQQLVMRDVRRIPEERVTAVLGTPAIVVGLGAGLDRSTFANYAEAREAAYEQNVIPSQNQLSADVRFQLLPDFEPDPWKWRYGFDLSKVRVLQEDTNKLSERLYAGWQAGTVKRMEVRRGLGLEVDEKVDDVYMLPSSGSLVPGDQTVEEAQAQAQEQALQQAQAQGQAHAEALARAGVTQNPPDGGGGSQAGGNGASGNGKPPAPKPAAPVAPKSLKLDLSTLYGHQTVHHARFVSLLQDDLDRLAGVLQEELESDFEELGLKAAAAFRDLAGPQLAARQGNGHRKAFFEALEVLANRISFALGLDSWRENQLRKRLEAHYRRVAEVTVSTIGKQLDREIHLDPLILEQLATEGGHRRMLIDIRGETRKALVTALDEAQKDNLSTEDIAKRIRGLVPAGTYSNVGAEGRAKRIALEETHHGQRLAALETYRAVGIDRLVMFDGTGDPDCAARNGKVVPLDDAQREIEREHIGGSLTFAPAVALEVATRTRPFSP